jgi:membrane-bound lytic murein transglycosylase MltF
MTREFYSSLLGFLAGCFFVGFLVTITPKEPHIILQNYTVVEQFVTTRGYILPSRDILKHIFVEAKRNKVDPFLMISLIIVESGFNENSVSKKGAVGLMQIMPKWHNVEVDKLFDPYYNVARGIEIYAKMLAQVNGNDIKALTKYSGDKSLKYAHKVLSIRETLVNYGPI